MAKSFENSKADRKADMMMKRKQERKSKGRK